jgi:hypothetical protein
VQLHDLRVMLQMTLTVHSTTEASSEADSGKKRARENDGGDETVAKKQDTKEGPAETS